MTQFSKGDKVVKSDGPDRVGIVERAWKAGSRVMRGGLVHQNEQYLVNWGGVTCYEDGSRITAAI